MAKTYKQRIYDELDCLLEKYPKAKVSDVIWALKSMAECLWRALPAPKKGRKVVKRQKRYRVA